MIDASLDESNRTRLAYEIPSATQRGTLERYTLVTGKKPAGRQGRGWKFAVVPNEIEELGARGGGGDGRRCEPADGGVRSSTTLHDGPCSDAATRFAHGPSRRA